MSKEKDKETAPTPIGASNSHAAAAAISSYTALVAAPTTGVAAVPSGWMFIRVLENVR